MQWSSQNYIWDFFEFVNFNDFSLNTFVAYGETKNLHYLENERS